MTTGFEAAYRNVRGLRAVRRFRDEPVDEDLLGKVLEAGRWTGSSKNSQRWAFVVVTDTSQQEALARAGRFTDPVRAAPVVIVVVSLPGGSDFDMGRAAQNLMLAAAALGLGSCPVTLHDEAAARAVLDVPGDHGCRWAVAVGHPAAADAEARPRVVGGGRKPTDDVVHRGRYEAR